VNRRERRWLILGIGVFCLVRAASVLVPAGVLNIPRLGDDALIYLWKGALNREGYDAGLPAVRDILEQRHLADNPPGPVSTMRGRVMGKVVGSPIPIYDFLTRLALSRNLRHKWAFALTELPGVVLMTAAFTGFLLHLFGEGAAGIGLALLAFAILPNQGIASFIPSALALSLSMLLWTYLLIRARHVRLLPVYAGAVLILGVHPIGWVYVLMAIPLHAVNLQRIGAVGERRTLCLYGG
jgi:hypothetical protein